MFPAKLNRAEFAANGIIVALISGVGLGLMAAFAEQVYPIHPIFPLLWMIGSYVYLVRYLAAPRMRSAGMSPHYLWLLLVPFVNMVILLILVFERPVEDKPAAQAAPPVIRAKT